MREREGGGEEDVRYRSVKSSCFIHVQWQMPEVFAMNLFIIIFVIFFPRLLKLDLTITLVFLKITISNGDSCGNERKCIILTKTEFPSLASTHCGWWFYHRLKQ